MMQGLQPFAGRTFRVVAPRWAHAPHSTEGARLHGGRFNPPGMAAFYSSLDPHTAYAEYTQALYDRPGLLCTFKVEAAGIVDLTEAGGLAAVGLTEAALSEPWIARRDSPTQCAAVELAAHCDGLIYRSLQHASGRNLVLWRCALPVRLELIDRLGEVPEG